MKTGNRGFTLIELVMVIVILAILAAVAIPRFIDLQEDARKSTAKGIGGAVAGAANILHSQYLLRGTMYVLGTAGTDTRDTAVLGNANISGGATVVASNPGLLGTSGSTSLITITVDKNTFYLMTITLTGNGPQVQYGF